MRHPSTNSATRSGTVRRLTACAAALSAFLVGGFALAQSTIRQPNAHPSYAVELEPHFVFGVFDPPGLPTGTGLGAGLRATVPILHNGFVPTINNSVGISFGADWVHYYGDELSVGYCARRVPGPGGTLVCTEVGGPMGGTSNYLYFPLAMQWNFWLTDNFSTFAEPGFAIYYEKARFASSGSAGAAPVFALGGRWHFLRRAMLTFRVGYPVMSLGVSMLF
jgi:hypothetical protein